MLDRILWCVESVSLGFDRWDDPHAKGPGLYFVVVEVESVAGFARPMGANRWPTESCPNVWADVQSLLEAASAVSVSHDGAVVVRDDGGIDGSMVRLEGIGAIDPELAGNLPYAGWMGARHMSALETSTREGVVAAVTLSEEDGRVTVFTDGEFEDHRRESLGGRWRSGD